MHELPPHAAGNKHRGQRGGEPAVKMEGHLAQEPSLQPMGSHRKCLFYCLLEVSLSNKSLRKNSCARKGKGHLSSLGAEGWYGPQFCQFGTGLIWNSWPCYLFIESFSGLVTGGYGASERLEDSWVETNDCSLCLKRGKNFLKVVGSFSWCLGSKRCYWGAWSENGMPQLESGRCGP